MSSFRLKRFMKMEAVHIISLTNEKQNLSKAIKSVICLERLAFNCLYMKWKCIAQGLATCLCLLLDISKCNLL